MKEWIINVNDEFFDLTFLLFLLLCAKWLGWLHNNSNYKSWRDTWERNWKLYLSLNYTATIHTRDIDISTPPLNGNVGMKKCHDSVNLSFQSLSAMLKTHALENTNYFVYYTQ